MSQGWQFPQKGRHVQTKNLRAGNMLFHVVQIGFKLGHIFQPLPTLAPGLNLSFGVCLVFFSVDTPNNQQGRVRTEEMAGGCRH